MKKVVITVDSAADLPKNIAKEYGIEIMPMHVVIEDKEKNDGVDINAPELFDYVEKTGVIPQTSAVSPGEYADFFDKFTSENKAVVHLSFCSELSSTCRNARMAAQNGEDVYVVDTLNLGGGIALLALKACEMRDKGVSAEEISKKITQKIHNVKVSYLLDSIDFLRRSGRCSAAAVFGANLLGIKPCAAMAGGRIEVIKKYRGKTKAVRLQYANEQLEKAENIDFSTAFIYHSGVDESELYEIENLLRNAGFKQVITAFTGCMISLHSGRNAIGIHFISESQV
ncbi:MAG: DegV family protein [Acutalibacteraceae bacterium]|nr:DegV family protein [Acutalibacteraceae bacterium]